MKTKLRMLLTFLLCLFACLCLGVAAYAEGNVVASGTCGAEGDNLTWTLDEGGQLTISGAGDMANYDYGTAPWYKNRLEIMSVMIEDGVTSIGAYAFINCSELAYIHIHESVASMGEFALGECPSLHSVIIPENLTVIERYAFAGCTGLTDIIIKEGVEKIGYRAFRYCNSLLSIAIPETVRSIGGEAFGQCSQLRDVFISSGLISIEAEAFRDCVSLTNIAIPDSVTEINYGAFQNCTNLKAVYLPEKITRISHYAFYHCEKLEEIVVPDGVTNIDAYAFLGCAELKNVFLPDSLLTIDESAFRACGNIINIILPNKLSEIKNSAFRDCGKLTDISIPYSVSTISDNAFKGCPCLQNVYYSGSKAQWQTIYIGENNDELLRAEKHYNGIAIAYDANGGENEPSIQKKVIGENLRLHDDIPIHEDDTQSILITFDANGGSVTPRRMTATRYTSYRFKDWNTRRDGSGTSYAPGAVFTADEDTTLYAQWSVETEDAPVSLPIPTRDGYIFLGWAESDDAERGFTGIYMPEGSVTLYALWGRPDFILPAALTEIGEEAFAGGNFTFVKLPDNALSVGPRAFTDCPRLAVILIPAQVTQIDQDAFGELETLTVVGTTGSTAEQFAAQRGFDFVPAA